MIDRLQYDFSNAADVFDEALASASAKKMLAANKVLSSRSGRGKEFLGWLDVPKQNNAELDRIEETASEMREISDAVLVIGIGGSYLGAKAVIDACLPFFQRNAPEIFYAGHHIDGEYLKELLASLEGKRVSVNVISKSGTTTEPALAFRVVRHWMERQYGKEQASRRIIATTDASRGALRALAEQEGYRAFAIPDDVGGRFSVLTPVGLLPISCAGISVRELLRGALAMLERTASADINSNPALAYAATRASAYAQGRIIEILASFHPRLHYVSEWWKQLFGESEGKGGKGVFPAAVQNTTDLHSLGQYIQDGERKLFETFLMIDNTGSSLRIEEETGNPDDLNYLCGVSFDEINENAYYGTALAHTLGGVPNSTIRIPDASPHSIGELLYFFEIAVALSGYALDVNPFDQPGVEEYKTNMFALLQKAGYMDRRKQLLTQIENKKNYIIK